MANIPKRFYTGQPDTTEQILYTVPLGKKAILRNIVFSNTKEYEARITLFLVPNGETANETNAVISDLPIIANNTVAVDLSAVIEENDKIVAVQRLENTITCFISGLEVD